MKKNHFIALVICTNIIFFLAHMRKQMLFIKESYRKQKNERLFARLEQQRQELTNKLCTAQSRTEIKSYAETTLHMRTAQLSQLKRLPHVHQ